MEEMISRSDARAIDEKRCQEFLAHFGIRQPKLLDKGSEAVVYELDENNVLKVYADVTRLGKLKVLAEFYRNIDSSQVSFLLPQIYDIHKEDDLLGVVERRIPGTSLSALMGADNQQQLFKTYVQAISELAKNW